MLSGGRLYKRLLSLNLFVIGEVSAELYSSQVFEKVNNDIDGASYGSR